MRAIVTAESVTLLGEAVRGAVLVAGSHGGLIAGHYAFEAGAHAVIFNDAGVGKDAAGIAALSLLEGVGMAAATVSHASARIGDGADALQRGRISHANRTATACGVAPGMAAHDAAVRLGLAPARTGMLAPATEARSEFRSGAEGTALRPVWGLDSVGKLLPEDSGRILIVGSHGALHGGRAESALGVGAFAAVFNDAGVGVDGVGITRLPVLAERGIAAATVSARSARIGDARSMWEGGRISHLNTLSERSGARPGMSVREWVAALDATAACAAHQERN